MQAANLSPKLELDLRDILDSLPFNAFLVDSRRRIWAANTVVKQDLGLDLENLIGAYCPIAIHGCHDPVVNCPLSRALTCGQSAEQDVFDSKSERWLNIARNSRRFAAIWEKHRCRWPCFCGVSSKHIQSFMYIISAEHSRHHPNHLVEPFALSIIIATNLGGLDGEPACLNRKGDSIWLKMMQREAMSEDATL